MKGREAVAMHRKTRVTWVLKPSLQTARSRPQRVIADPPEPKEALRARLLAATVELAAEGSNPRLVKTLHACAAA
jgi:hypothetical protein